MIYFHTAPSADRLDFIAEMKHQSQSHDTSDEFTSQIYHSGIHNNSSTRQNTSITEFAPHDTSQPLHDTDSSSSEPQTDSMFSPSQQPLSSCRPPPPPHIASSPKPTNIPVRPHPGGVGSRHPGRGILLRRRHTGLAYIAIILCYGLFLPRDVMSWSSRPPRHVVPPPTSPRPTLPPVFDPRPPTNITVTASKTAVMSCVVHNLANNSVSWIRHRDLHILSVGIVTYTNDDRFLIVPNTTTGDWALRLMYAQPADSGQYDCQVSSTPTTGRTFHLEIIEPQAEVLRAPEMHVGVGSLINLTCVVPYSPETPEYLHWYHKERMVREDGHRVWVRTTLGSKSISQLVVMDAQPSDSGRYTCSPAHSREHSITVHVLTAGEYPAAMQGGSSLTCAPHWRLLRLMVAPIATLLIASHKPYFYM